MNEESRPLNESSQESPDSLLYHGSAKNLASMGEWAARYAVNGWRIVPLHTPQGNHCSCDKSDCSKIGKHPRISDWQHAASCDPATIATWWAQFANANIGMTMDGLACLDVDGAEGLESLAKLEAEHGILDPAVRQRSGSGGWHYLFEAVPGVEKRIKFQPGLDLLTGAGCYIVAAPSLHASGGRYEWVDEHSPLSAHRDQIPLTVPPGWLLCAAANEKPKTAPRAKRPAAERVPVDRIMGKALENVRAGSGRNDAGLAYFVQLRDNQYSRDEALLTIRDWVAKANEATPGQDRYTQDEAKSTLRSAYSQAGRIPNRLQGKVGIRQQ